MQILNAVLRRLYIFMIAVPIGFIFWGLILFFGLALNVISPKWWASTDRSSPDFVFVAAYGVLCIVIVLTFWTIFALAVFDYAQLPQEAAIAAGDPKSAIVKSIMPLRLPYLIAFTAGIVGVHLMYGKLQAFSSSRFVQLTVLGIGYIAFLFGSWQVLAV